MKDNDDETGRATVAKLDRPGHGTTIVVINILGNLPVRQKHLQHSIEIEQLKNELQAIALVHPQVNYYWIFITDFNLSD